MKKSIFGLAHAFRTDTGGSPALEFALIAPLLFSGVFGSIELGRALYERNQFSAAAAIATREIAKDSTKTAADIKLLLERKLGYSQGELTINVTDANQTIAGQEFKEINISYEFKFLVSVHKNFSGVTLATTRYAPVMS